MKTPRLSIALAILAGLFAGTVHADDPKHPLMTWVKQHPRADAKIPSPRLGYEGSIAYDPASKLLIRWAGHNQGNGGEQNAETWTYDLDKDLWTLKQPNDAPPGACCNHQNVFHDALGKFIRFPAFSNSHGWQSAREVSLRNNSVWTYDLPSNTWTNMRPVPEPQVRPLRGAAYDPEHEVIVIHGGEGAKHNTLIYDLYTNTWHWPEPKNPPPRSQSQPGFAYDAVNKVFVLFGSQFGSDPRTWIYDLPKNEWKVLKTNTTPPFNKSAPVLAADTRNGIILCSVKGDDGPETWVLDVAKATWNKLDVKWQGENQDKKTMNGNRNRILLYLPDRNLFVQEIRTKTEQQIWTFRYAEAPAPLPRVPDFTSKGVFRVDKSFGFGWAKQTKGSTFNVHRGMGETPWKAKWQQVAKEIKENRYTEEEVKPGINYWYRVEFLDANKKTFGFSTLVSTRPRVPQWPFAVSPVEAKKVALRWEGAGPGVGLRLTPAILYHVERAPVLVYSTDQVKSIKQRLQPTSELSAGAIKQIGPFKRLTSKPFYPGKFDDSTADFAAGQAKAIEKPLRNKELRPDQLEPDGKPYKYAVYAYRVIAVNRMGFESGPSPIVFTFPSSPQHVFAKEEGKTATALKWEANPEKNLKGYLVYRHDGRFSNSKIVCLTPEPIKATTFLDKESGPGTRRYEIVAVDALGQHGIPSQPVWSRREWQSFYVPYAGEWHQ